MCVTAFLYIVYFYIFYMFSSSYRFVPTRCLHFMYIVIIIKKYITQITLKCALLVVVFRLFGLIHVSTLL